jgi:hypothetical protein
MKMKENHKSNPHATNEFVQSPRFRHRSGTQNEEITWAVVTIVIENYMTLSIVESQRNGSTMN